MTIAKPFHTDSLANSPYARELQGGVSHLRFAEPLETQYIQERLSDSRVLIRLACMLSALIAFLRAAEKVFAGTGDLWSLTDLGFVTVISIALAGLAWGPQYQRVYMSWARILVPARNSVVAFQVAAAAAHGQLEMLMVLPIMLFGPFFFLGLRYRAALVCSVLTVLAYVISASAWNMPLSVATRSYAFLLIGLIAFMVAGRHLEKSSRLAFLKGRLIATLAQHDSLTGAKNRRVFDEHLSSLWRRAAEEHRGIAVLLIDIDYFKVYNDCYGHQAGDRTLRQVAHAIGSLVCSPTDVLARYGGEEFAAVLYDADIRDARQMAEKMRSAVAELNINHHGSGVERFVTISVGVAAVCPNLSRSPGGALQLADEALYEAKVSGRNRVEIRDEREHDMVVTGVFGGCPQPRSARA
ncbi:MAG: GGDEF domain-containing protein [Proteobacteria bacterium]|nr:GGDEF domain-containing protein [Pseudomonadota bacterium]